MRGKGGGEGRRGGGEAAGGGVGLADIVTGAALPAAVTVEVGGELLVVIVGGNGLHRSTLAGGKRSQWRNAKVARKGLKRAERERESDVDDETENGK